MTEVQGQSVASIRRIHPFRRIASDPLTHFIAAGALIFAVYFAVKPEPTEIVKDEKIIELTPDDLRRIALVWEAQGQDAPSPEQVRELAEREVIQRILAHEARLLGLDQDDEVIERRLAQKMDFLLTDLAALQDPSEEQLRVWYEANRDRFVLPPRASFSHLYFSQDRRGVDGARIAAAQLLGTIEEMAPGDPGLKGKADRFMFRNYYGGRTPLDILKEFGPEFAEDLFTLTPGAWFGPIRSGYGWHLVWIDTLQPGRTADFKAIEADVRSAFLEERYTEIKQRAYAEMRGRYTIVIPDFEALKQVPENASARSEEPRSPLVQ